MSTSIILSESDAIAKITYFTFIYTTPIFYEAHIFVNKYDSEKWC